MIKNKYSRRFKTLWKYITYKWNNTNGKMILVFGLIMRDRKPQSFGVDRDFIKTASPSE